MGPSARVERHMNLHAAPRWLTATSVAALLLPLLVATSARACSYDARDTGFDAREAVGPVALSLTVHAASGVVLYKLWHETEPSGRATLRWHLAGAAVVVANFALGVRGAGACGPAYAERRVWPLVGAGHLVGMFATVGLPLIWHVRSWFRRHPNRPGSGDFVPTVVPLSDASNGGRLSGFTLGWRW